MSYAAVFADTGGSKRLFDQTLNRSFNAAYLLTASTRQAEAAVVKAIDRFDPNIDTEEGLFRYALRAAVQTPPERELGSTARTLPPELQAVLTLTQELRHCFVLRVLIGISRQACGELLGLNTQRVDESTFTAMRRLAGFA
jgi:hypothetical protein